MLIRYTSMQRPHGCLIALLAWCGLGAIIYNLPNVDPEGDGAGGKFIGVTLVGAMVIAVFMVARRIDRRRKRRREGASGFPVASRQLDKE